MSEPNMAKLKPSRKKARTGDVFVMHYPAVGYIFGRVIAADLPPGSCPMSGDNLVCIYDVRTQQPKATREMLKDARLLIPPAFTNQLGWARGYFQTIDHWPLDEDESPEGFCFDELTLAQDLTLTKHRYRTLDGRVLPNRSEPCGRWVLSSYLLLDDVISDALGVAPAPEDGTNAADEPAGPAVFIHIPSGRQGVSLDTLEDAIADALVDAGAGELDGHVIGRDMAIIHLYGADPDAIIPSIRQVLQNVDLPSGSYAIKYSGPPENSQERVELG
ncbi:MAG: Imm26 family immunity protein [Micromonosporaceae bacterium]